MKIKILVLFAFAVWFGPGQLPAADILPLAGEWRFALDRNDVGTNENWFAKDLPDKIRLPGILQAQGFGDDIATNTPWVITLGDAWWELQPAALRDHFSRPGRVEVPFLSQPPKHYLGAAWYQRDIEIPDDWKGHRVALFLERPHWKTTIWLDDKEIGSDISLCTPHECELGMVARASRPREENQKLTGGTPVPLQMAPGKHRLTIRVDNRLQLPDAGHLADSHSISDALGAAWNGIVGKIELQSTPPVWIDDVRIFPDVTNKSLRAQMTLHNLSGQEAGGKISFFIEPSSETKPLNVLPRGENFNTASDTNLAVEAEINLGGQAELWGEFSPALYRLHIKVSGDLGGKSFQDDETNTFGLREITHNDKDPLINGRPVNLRLTHDGGEFPLTGYPAMDVASWKKIIQTCKDYGLNGIRFHSWCPPEAAFEAADEMGFYLQPECGLWADFSDAATRDFLDAETARILAAYGNHPSFILLSPGNEPKNYQRLTPQWAATNHLNDPRRLYSAGTGWSDPSQVNDGAQFATLVRYGDGQLRNATGWFGGDYRDALTDVHLPVLAHEVGQWCAYPDFDVMKKFTGYLRPGNYDIFQHIAAQNGVLDEDKDFAWASGRFQVECYKEEIEANLRTPGLAGFELLDLHDYLGQGTALIGVLDAFWQPKSYVTAAEFRKFCNSTVPLAWLNKRVFTTDEKLEADIGIAHFGAETLKQAYVMWFIYDKNGKRVAGGYILGPMRDLPVGFRDKLYHFSTGLTNLPAPAQYKLVATTTIPPLDLTNESYQNSWNFWLYPAQVDTNTPSDVLVTRNWSEAATRLAAGGKVLFLPGAGSLDPAKCPPMKNVPVFWNILATVRPPKNPLPKFDAFLGLLCETNSPALAEFPTEKNCDWQWTGVINNVRAVNLTAAPREWRPIVWAIDDWSRNWKLGVIFECGVGPGKLLVSAINLNDRRGGAELRQLRRSLLDYMGSDKFHPVATLTPEQAGRLWAHGGPAATNAPARVFDQDLNDGTIPPP